MYRIETADNNNILTFRPSHCQLTSFHTKYTNEYLSLMTSECTSQQNKLDITGLHRLNASITCSEVVLEK